MRATAQADGLVRRAPRDGLEADEAGVADDRVDRFRICAADQVPGVGLFQHDDPGSVRSFQANCP